MDYTTSPQYAVHTGTGNRLHDDAATLPTVLSDGDINQLTWSMMEVVKAAGLTPLPFNPDVPASYRQFLQALQATVTGLAPAPVSDVPPGLVAYYAMANPPPGWIRANGAAVSRTSYAQLFSVIGTFYGLGDGSSTFNLPDLRGIFLRGVDDGRNMDPGRFQGSLQYGEVGPHGHLIKMVNLPVPGSLSYQNGPQDVTFRGEYTSLQPTQTNDGFETRPVNVALLACIKY